MQARSWGVSVSLDEDGILVKKGDKLIILELKRVEEQIPLVVSMMAASAL